MGLGERPRLPPGLAARARRSAPTRATSSLTHHRPTSPPTPPAELLNYNSGLELEILHSLVRSDVHVKILAVLADPARVFSSPALPEGSPHADAFRMRSYALFCKEYLGGVETNLHTLNAEARAAHSLFHTLQSQRSSPHLPSLTPRRVPRTDPLQIEQQEREGPVRDADDVLPVVYKADMEKSLFVRLLVHGYLVTFMLMARTRHVARYPSCSDARLTDLRRPAPCRVSLPACDGPSLRETTAASSALVSIAWFCNRA